MTQKTYRNLVCQNYGTTLTVNGQSVHINFSGGRRHPVLTYGKFSTSDPSIIEALESHKNYGKEWILEETPVMFYNEPEPVQMPDAPETDAPETDAPVVTQSNIIKTTVTTENATIVLEPKNVQQAKDWLNKNKNIPYSKMKLRDDLFNVAKELNIDFQNVLK